jgi:hypothetical protein
MDSCLVSSYQLNSIKLSKPKKYSEYYVSKVKYSVDDEEDSDLVLQFPKMTLSEDPEEKNISVEFMNTRGYNKEVYNFLSGLDTYITEQVSKKSEEWFGKEIPLKSIKKMYNAFIKPPKTTEARCVINFGIKYHKEEVKTLFLDRKDNEISFSHFKKDEIVECIAQCKYIFFSKDTCFSAWELVSAKIHKKMQKVPDFGFVDDPDDRVVKVESDDEEDPDFSNAQFF